MKKICLFKLIALFIATSFLLCVGGGCSNVQADKITANVDENAFFPAPGTEKVYSSKETNKNSMGGMEVKFQYILERYLPPETLEGKSVYPVAMAICKKLNDAKSALKNGQLPHIAYYIKDKNGSFVYWAIRINGKLNKEKVLVPGLPAKFQVGTNWKAKLGEVPLVSISEKENKPLKVKYVVVKANEKFAHGKKQEIFNGCVEYTGSGSEQIPLKKVTLLFDYTEQIIIAPDVGVIYQGRRVVTTNADDPMVEVSSTDQVEDIVNNWMRTSATTTDDITMVYYKLPSTQLALK